VLERFSSLCFLSRCTLGPTKSATEQFSCDLDVSACLRDIDRSELDLTNCGDCASSQSTGIDSMTSKRHDLECITAVVQQLQKRVSLQYLTSSSNVPGKLPATLEDQF
jgi:hypothetical protein